MIDTTHHDRRGTRTRIALAVTAAVAVAGCGLVAYRLELHSLQVTPVDPTLAGATTQQLTATGRYEDASERDVTAEAAWASSRPEVATVSAAGLVTPLGAGTTTVTASLQGVSGSTVLTVTNAQLVSIEVTPASPSIANGTRLRFVAIGHFDDGSTQDLTSQATWSSSDPSVTIDDAPGAEGLAASIALGPAVSTITASFGGISGQTTLTVSAVALAALSVSPAAATINVGASQQFAATGTFSDASTQDMTAEVAWDSSSTSVATVSSTGRAVGVFAGSATITATSSALLGSATGDAQLTVKTASPGY